MNGAESLVRTLLGCGVEVCFANPGTSEMHFVAALDRVPGMRCVLALQENVATGCADGYWRMAEKPAATLMHCGPGLANGLANLHNARRAGAGIVNIVGDQATYHRPLDPPLTADAEGWARGVSAWVRTAASAREVGADAAVAVQAARTSPGRVATLILPADTAWDEGGEVALPLPVPAPPRTDPHAVQEAARVLREGRNVLLMLGGRALHERPLALAHRVAAATGCRLLAETFNARLARGRGRPAIERVPYDTDLALEALRGVEHLVLVGARAPVGFFAYPGKPGRHYPPGAEVHVLARPEHDAAEALEALAAELGAPLAAVPDPGPRPEPGRGVADARGPGPHVGGAAARGGGRGRRGDHARRPPLRRDERRGAARVAPARRRGDRRRACRSRPGRRWARPGGGWSTCRRTARPCTRSRRCGRRRGSGCR